MKTAVKKHGTTRENPGGMQWRKESLLALTGSRSRITAPGKDNLWLVTELRLTGWERQLLRLCRPPDQAKERQVLVGFKTFIVKYPSNLLE